MMTRNQRLLLSMGQKQEALKEESSYTQEGTSVHDDSAQEKQQGESLLQKCKTGSPKEIIAGYLKDYKNRKGGKSRSLLPATGDVPEWKKKDTSIDPFVEGRMLGVRRYEPELLSPLRTTVGPPLYESLPIMQIDSSADKSAPALTELNRACSLMSYVNPYDLLENDYKADEFFGTTRPCTSNAITPTPTGLFKMANQPCTVLLSSPSSKSFGSTEIDLSKFSNPSKSVSKVSMTDEDHSFQVSDEGRGKRKTRNDREDRPGDVLNSPVKKKIKLPEITEGTWEKIYPLLCKHCVALLSLSPSSTPFGSTGIDLSKSISKVPPVQPPAERLFNMTNQPSSTLLSPGMERIDPSKLSKVSATEKDPSCQDSDEGKGKGRSRDDRADRPGDVNSSVMKKTKSIQLETNCSFEKMYPLCKEFFEEHSHCVIPTTTKPLGPWVKRVRYHYKLLKQGKGSVVLNDDQIQKLNDIHFCWDVPRHKWDVMYGKVRNFIQQHRHTDFPKGGETRGASSWTKTQKRNHESNLLSKDQVEKLQELHLL